MTVWLTSRGQLQAGPAVLSAGLRYTTLGLSLSQIVTLLAIVLPQGRVPSRATGGRWVQPAAAQAGRMLVVLDLACQARVQVLCLDEIFLHREPVLMAIEPESMAWMAGQRGPDRSGESWAQGITADKNFKRYFATAARTT
jgi:hypothetical protein